MTRFDVHPLHASVMSSLSNSARSTLRPQTMTARASHDTAPKGRRPQNRGFWPHRLSGVALACRGPVRWNRHHRSAPDASAAFITEGSEVVGTCSFSGSIIPAERIELRAEARVYGDLETAVLVIEEGAVFEGQTRPPIGQGADARRNGAGDPRPGATT